MAKLPLTLYNIPPNVPWALKICQGTYTKISYKEADRGNDLTGLALLSASSFFSGLSISQEMSGDFCSKFERTLDLDPIVDKLHDPQTQKDAQGNDRGGITYEASMEH